MRASQFWIVVVYPAVVAITFQILPIHSEVSRQPTPGPADQGTVDFVQEIQPIFRKSCYGCHGPSVQMGELRLDSKAEALRGGVSGAAILLGKSGESLLVQRLMGLGDRARMPLQGEALTDHQISSIRKWIDQGASWSEEAPATDADDNRHWAYRKPVRPIPPQVRDSGWTRNPIDHFVQAVLEKEALQPAPEAPPEVLLRRVTLDLTGLPPSLEEVDAFLADQNPEKYERVVDRLLASPHFGERWARPWLDLARYADTDGYEKDQRRSIWKYRDWVIDALNRDMPFDQFTIEQIAGDMLPDATIEQRTATGFHRNTMFNNEDGVDQEEARWTVLLDRVNTTATTWLGTTLACAQCHDHKYDPFTQKDYYRFLAFFENAGYQVVGKPGSPEERFVEPVLDLATPDQQKKRRSLEDEIARLNKVLETQTQELNEAQSLWEREQTRAQNQWSILDAVSFSSAGGAVLDRVYGEDHSLQALGTNPKNDVYRVVTSSKVRGITAFQLEVLPVDSPLGPGPGRGEDGDFLLTGFRVEAAPVGQTPNPVAVARADADFSAQGFPVANAIDGDSETGWAIAPRIGEAHQAVFESAKPLGDGEEITLIFTLAHESRAAHRNVARFRLSVTSAANPSPVLLGPDNIRRIFEIPLGQRSDEQKAEQSRYFRSITPLLGDARRRLSRLKQDLRQMAIASTLVMEERPSFERPSTYFRVRGSFLNKGEKVYADVPGVLNPLPQSQMPNRLGLAHWLVAPDNPLVARVTVNRIWEEYFGRGIVETADNFGTRGEPPSHPDLLDWLASELVRGGWSLKAIHRLIVTSATYRQSSAVSPALLERDPYNRLLARGARFRMEAEMIRDLALSTGGLLSRRIAGPSVFPYQPDGIWSLPYNTDQWVTSEGKDQHRRGVYTFWRRTAPYPSFMNFDAVSREVCTAKRSRTNTPLQALTTLNDPAFFEASRALARRLWSECAGGILQKIKFGFRLCTSRSPNIEELNALLTLYEQQLRLFNRDLTAAKQIVGGAEFLNGKVGLPQLAASTVVSNVLLNMDQTLTKE